MKRVVIQLKKRLDKIDFRKIHKGFSKCNFLLRYKNNLYDTLKTYPSSSNTNYYIIIEDITYAIIDYPSGPLNYNNLLIELISIMFKVYYSKINHKFSLDNELEFLIKPKNSLYYEFKYKQNLLFSKLLTSKVINKNELKIFLSNRIKQNKIVQKEIEIEKYYGMEKYIKLKTIKLIDESLYNNEIIKLINILEDPSNLFNYFNYVKEYGAALLMIKNNSFKQTNYESYIDDNLLINFQYLLKSNNTKIRRIMMYKMIHARKIKITGKLKNARLEKVLNNEDLYYLPEMIEYTENGVKKVKKGDFIIKINDDLEIIESYECLSLSKII